MDTVLGSEELLIKEDESVSSETESIMDELGKLGKGSHPETVNNIAKHKNNEALFFIFLPPQNTFI